jgi:hypothetical protein
MIWSDIVQCRCYLLIKQLRTYKEEPSQNVYFSRNIRAIFFPSLTIIQYFEFLIGFYVTFKLKNRLI